MSRSSLPPRLVLATILAIGIAPLWITGTALVFEYLEPSQPSAGSLWIRPDGTPLLYHYSPGGNVVEYQDLSGKPVEVPPGEESLPLIDLIRSDEARGSVRTVEWQQRIRSFTDTRNQPTFWYLIDDGRRPGSAYFVGYNAANNRRVGYLGAQGFRTDPLPADECFAFSGGLNMPVTSRQTWYQSAQLPASRLAHSFTADHEFASWNVYLLAESERLYRIDLKDRSVKPVLNMPNLRSCQLYTKQQGGPALLAVCTHREVLLLDDNYQVKRRYVLSEALSTKTDHPGEGAFRWAEIEPGKAIAYWTELPTSHNSDRVDHIVWFDEAGKVSRREAISRSQQSPSSVAMATIVPIPLFDFVGVCWLYPWELLDDAKAEGWPQAIATSLTEFWLMLVIVGLFSTFLAVVAWFRLAKYSASPTERIFWTAFVWLGGLPGWLAFRFGQRWPVLERCSHCGRIVPRDQIACARCAREFSRPAPQGIEILVS